MYGVSVSVCKLNQLFPRWSGTGSKPDVKSARGETTVAAFHWLSTQGTFSRAKQWTFVDLLCVTQGGPCRQLPRGALSSSLWATMVTADSSPVWRRMGPNPFSSSAPPPRRAAPASSRSSKTRLPRIHLTLFPCQHVLVSVQFPANCTTLLLKYVFCKDI